MPCVKCDDGIWKCADDSHPCDLEFQQGAVGSRASQKNRIFVKRVGGVCNVQIMPGSANPVGWTYVGTVTVEAEGHISTTDVCYATIDVTLS